MYIVVHDLKVFNTESNCWLNASSGEITQLIKMWVSVLHTNIRVVAFLWLHASHAVKVCVHSCSVFVQCAGIAVDPY